MLNEEARRALSKLAINVFTPAVMITKLGAHADLASALSLWPIGANVIIWWVGVASGDPECVQLCSPTHKLSSSRCPGWVDCVPHIVYVQDVCSCPAPPLQLSSGCSRATLPKDLRHLSKHKHPLPATAVPLTPSPFPNSHFVGLGLGMLHTRLLPTPQNLKHIIHVSSSITNTGKCVLT